MKTLMIVLFWCMLFLLSAPLAVVAIVLWPLCWLIALPLRLLAGVFAAVFNAIFALLNALLCLPARLLGSKPARA